MALSKVTEKTLEKAKEFDLIRFVFSDLHGISRCRCATKACSGKYLEKGLDLYYATIAVGPSLELTFDLPGIVESKFGNMTILPASDVICEVPWAAGSQHRIGEIICETVYKGEYQEANPRTMARRQLQRLEDLGYELLSATECEFILKKCNDEATCFEPMFQFGSTLSWSAFEDVFMDLNDHLLTYGIEIEKMHCEYVEGQVEFTLTPRLGIEMADSTFKFKTAVKDYLKKKELAIATFMTKPDAEGGVSSGMHFNHSLWHKDTKSSAMYDLHTSDHLTDVSRHWIAGLVKHAPAITALCCPTFNCYRRLHSPWSPDLANWGFEDRFTAFRANNNGPTGTYVENRLPSSACNPYLVMAGTVAAGVDGIINKLELPKEGDRSAPSLPHSLEEALVALEKDAEIADALGKGFMDWFVEIKRKFECERFKEHNVKENSTEQIAKECEYYLSFI